MKSIDMSTDGADSQAAKDGRGSDSASIDATATRRLHPRPRPPKLYRIGEITEYAGVSRQTIHNYTAMGLIRESTWTRGGHRLYDEPVFERLDRIAQLKAVGRSIAEIRQELGDEGPR